MTEVSYDKLVDDMLREAMSWINTPFQDQGRIKGLGVDCVHFIHACLITTVGGQLGFSLDIPHDYRPKEDGTVMLRWLDAFLEFVPTEQRARGDIPAFIDPDLRDPGRPSHLAFIHEITPLTTYIIEASRRGVVRHRLDGLWMKRIHSVWRVSIDRIQAYKRGEFTLG